MLGVSDFDRRKEEATMRPEKEGDCEIHPTIHGPRRTRKSQDESEEVSLPVYEHTELQYETLLQYRRASVRRPLGGGGSKPVKMYPWNTFC